MSSTAHAALLTGGTDPATGLSLPQIVTMVAMLGQAVASIVAPGATLAGMTLAQIGKLAIGVANAVPSALAAFDEIKLASSNGSVPTPEQWDAWNAMADDAHAELQAAAKAAGG